VPQPTLTRPELRLAAFCKAFALLYFAAAAGFALVPDLTYRLATLGAPSVSSAEATFWNVLAVSMMTAAGTACLVTAARPRERRHAILPVVVANLTSGVVAALHLFSDVRSRALTAVLLVDLPLFALTLLLYRSAAPGVHSEPARETPQPAEEEAPKIQLKVSKS